ncbi:hypothetical protein [Kitasatospora griseola]|uniref:hypothetical protein n=1 Tax=Kitasatospora griseola TaxID=2064 RepID=UPI00381A62E9
MDVTVTTAGGSVTITYSVTVTGKGDRQLHNAVAASDGTRGTCASEVGCTTDPSVQAESTPSPSPPSTRDGQQPGNSVTSGGGSSTQQGSSSLASTGGSVFAPTVIGAALLIVGGLAVALTRRRGRRG